MAGEKSYQLLTESQVKTLIAQGCTAIDFNQIKVAAPFDPSRVRNTHFSGSVSIGKMDRFITMFAGLERKAGIYNAMLHNCNVGDNVYINNVKNYIANYDIEDDVIIDNIALLAVEQKTSFGNGSKAVVINEAGGREVPIYDHLSSNIAYILALYRHNKIVIEKLEKLIADYVLSVTTTVGTVGKGAKIINCGTLKNIKVGPAAVIEGAAALKNGTINSCTKDPCFVGTGVCGENFIFSTGSKITQNAIIKNCFVGQAALVANQFSAQDCLLFANCEAIHGEACSVFAGPFTATHHKSTLLIAAMCSFFNAGSGFNQSNHMYKLGAVHQGILERGVKAASDAYICWPAKVGAFTLIKGRHYTKSDTSNMPFSYLIEKQGKSFITPAVNLQSIGIIRDACKWPKRDTRKGGNNLDLINFSLLNPYSVSKIINGVEILQQLKQKAEPDCQLYHYQGLKIKQSALENGIDFYQTAINQYLGDIITQALQEEGFKSIADIHKILTSNTDKGEGRWLDLAGLIAPQSVINELLNDVEADSISSLTQLASRLNKIHDNFKNHQLAWTVTIVGQQLNKTIEQFTNQDVIKIIEDGINAAEKRNTLLVNDAKAEFAPEYRVGYGVDGGDNEKNLDFKEVRATPEDSDIINELKSQLKEKKKATTQLVEKLRKIG
ncbi:MAG: DUF4954 family protein [Planctomycetes bacterium]|nr:DUF4954 family protein [Planctomycetota bacterium]